MNNVIHLQKKNISSKEDWCINCWMWRNARTSGDKYEHKRTHTIKYSDFTWFTSRGYINKKEQDKMGQGEIQKDQKNLPDKVIIQKVSQIVSHGTVPLS